MTSAATPPADEGGWVEIKGDHLLLKVIERKDTGDAAKPVKSGDTVLINLVGRQANDRDHADGPIFQEAKSWLVTIGEPHCLLRALEYGIERMMAGQKAYIYSTSKYNFAAAYGQEATEGKHRKYKPSPKAEEVSVSATSNVIYEVNVLQIVMDTSRLNPYFPIQKALTMKNIANDIYQYEWEFGNNARERAVCLYEKAGKSMKTLLGGTYFASVEECHPQRKQSREIMLDCFNNVVAVYIRAKRWQKGRDACSNVLKEDSKNVKALLRNAKCYMLDPNKTLDEKDEALKKAENVIVYKDKEEVELKKLRSLWKKQKNAE